MDLNENFRRLYVGLPEDIRRLKERGDFDEARAAIAARLSAAAAPEALRGCLTAQSEMIRRLPGQFPYSRAEAIALVRERVADFGGDEFDRLVERGGVKWIFLGGERRFFGRFFDTLCKVDANFARRAGVVPAGSEPPDENGESRLDRSMRLVRERGMAVRFRVRAGLRANDGVFRAGERLRAALPLPCACPVQSDIVIEKISPEPSFVAPEDAPQRTVTWDGRWTENPGFSVEYSFTRRGASVDFSRPPARPARPLGGAPGPGDLAELPPHLMFSPFIRDLARQLAGNADGALEKARAFYDFITLNVKYHYVPEYFCLEDIAAECARSLTGDCGVQALLFIALCRVSGIPARWESGLVTRPGFCSGHDWARFWAEPFGWIYADPSFGGAAVRDGSEARRRFYFGGLDPWRMAANSAFQHGFAVPWEGWRADPYDNQGGEMMSGGRGLEYDEFARVREVLSCRELMG